MYEGLSHDVEGLFKGDETMIIGNIVGGKPAVKSYILETEDGQEIPAVMTDQEIVFTATPNDIREGKVAATGNGVTIGEKVIPSYHTSEGSRVIPVGYKFTIPLKTLERYKYTKLQAIICPYKNSISESVSAEKVSIDSKVYNVNSDSAISVVATDDAEQSIDLGITNNTDKPFIIRYITYKEIY